MEMSDIAPDIQADILEFHQSWLEYDEHFKDTSKPLNKQKIVALSATIETITMRLQQKRYDAWKLHERLFPHSPLNKFNASKWR